MGLSWSQNYCFDSKQANISSSLNKQRKVLKPRENSSYILSPAVAPIYVVPQETNFLVVGKLCLRH